MLYPRLVVAGTSSGIGKTTMTLAILSALQARGRRVQAFKVGPDFIDPGHHAAVTGRPSRNLDGWMLSEDENRSIFCRAAADADVSIVEGMMGLFDGASPTSEAGSSAQVAKQLQAPVLLVIDAGAMARSVAAMALGYATFDPHLKIAGILFNRVGGEKHYQLLKRAIEAESDLSVVGYLPVDGSVTVADRHLGLRTAIEQRCGGLYARLATLASECVDLSLIERLAGTAPELERPPTPAFGSISRGRIRLAVAHDPAFCFYYQDNLDLLRAAGAEIVNFSPLQEARVPEADLLYLGGGYPELYGAQLARNAPLRASIRAFAQRGGAIYAECGGLMYLTEGIRDFDGQYHQMVGIFPARAIMQRPGLVLGYREIELSRSCLLGEAGTTARGHEFHYSRLEVTGRVNYAWTLRDAHGERRAEDGLIDGKVLAAYTHLHFGSRPELAQRLMEAVRA